MLINYSAYFCTRYWTIWGLISLISTTGLYGIISTGKLLLWFIQGCRSISDILIRLFGAGSKSLHKRSWQS